MIILHYKIINATLEGIDRHRGDGGVGGAIAPQFWGKSMQTNKAKSKSGEYFENYTHSQRNSLRQPHMKFREETFLAFQGTVYGI